MIVYLGILKVAKLERVISEAVRAHLALRRVDAPSRFRKTTYNRNEVRLLLLSKSPQIS